MERDASKRVSEGRRTLRSLATWELVVAVVLAVIARSASAQALAPVVAQEELESESGRGFDGLHVELERLEGKMEGLAREAPDGKDRARETLRPSQEKLRQIREQARELAKTFRPSADELREMAEALCSSREEVRRIREDARELAENHQPYAEGLRDVVREMREQAGPRRDELRRAIREAARGNQGGVPRLAKGAGVASPPTRAPWRR